VNSYQHVVNSI